MSRFFRRIWLSSLYVVIPAMAGVSPLLVIPAVTRKFGAAGWASVAVALSIGTTAAVIAELGWGVVGPQRVAQRPNSALSTYEQSVASRLVTVGLVAPVAGIASYVLAAEHRGAAALVTIGAAMNGLSASWFFIGNARPLAIILGDALPKAGTALLAAAGIGMGGPLEFYGLALLLGAVLSYLLSARLSGATLLPSIAQFAFVPRTIRNQLIVVLGRTVGTVYTALAVTIVATAQPSAVATFAALVVPMRMGLTLLTGIPNRLQRWIGTSSESLLLKRIRKSLAINLCTGIFAGLCYALLMPLVARLIFANVAELSENLVLLGGATVLIICMSRGLGLVLVALGKSNSITYGASCAAVIGVPLIFALSYILGPAGGLGGMLIAELVGAVWQCAALWRAVTMAKSTCSFPLAVERNDL